MLTSPDVRVLAITTSDGVLSAKEAYIKLRAFLSDNYNEGILTGANINENTINANCIAAKAFKWGKNETLITNMPSHLDIIREVLKQSPEKIIFVNLGSLSTYHSAYKTIEALHGRVKQTLWTCDYKKLSESFNYKADSIAYQSLTKENVVLNLINGNIEGFDFEYFTTKGLESNNYANNFLRSLSEVNSPFARKCYDETLAIYLHYPDNFKRDSINASIISYNAIKSNKYNKLIINILNGNTVNQNQVFSQFPMDTIYYSDDVKPMVHETVKKYGRTEWIATVMANEMHRHLGIYAVIGTKMGIRAREYFGAGVDEMQVVSCAGSSPPYSCMNDGLQISTGATLGHGLIKLESDTLRLPKAVFTYMGRKISIRLKTDYQKRIESEIKMLVLVYGLDSNLYWDLVRKTALDFWRFWDRHEIFDLETL